MLIVGLGNPGPEYERTRHNAGFLVVDEFAERLDIRLQKPRFVPISWGRTRVTAVEVYCVKPYTYMNRSGAALGQIFKKTGCTVGEMIVVCDSLDLDPGMMRIKRRGGSGGQKGLESIIQTAGTDNFPRIFIGIGRPEYKGQVPSYVLDEPAGKESELFRGAVKRAADALEKLITLPLDKVMNEYNRGI